MSADTGVPGYLVAQAGAHLRTDEAPGRETYVVEDPREAGCGRTWTSDGQEPSHRHCCRLTARHPDECACRCGAYRPMTTVVNLTPTIDVTTAQLWVEADGTLLAEAPGCTCPTGDGPGPHAPGCGWQALVDLTTVPGWVDVVNAAVARRRRPDGYDPAYGWVVNDVMDEADLQVEHRDWSGLGTGPTTRPLEGVAQHVLSAYGATATDPLCCASAHELSTAAALAVAHETACRQDDVGPGPTLVDLLLAAVLRAACADDPVALRTDLVQVAALAVVGAHEAEQEARA